MSATPEDARRAAESSSPPAGEEAARRWRLVLGTGGDPDTASGLSKADQAMDQALAAVYDSEETAGEPRSAGLGSSSPRVAKWLGDIRTYFPNTVVHVMQRDAIERLNLKRLLLEPEMLASLQPDVHLVSTLIALNQLLPDTARATARQVVQRVVTEVEKRIADRTRAAIRGALNRGARSRRPLARDIDWSRTIAANLRTYQPRLRTVIPERLVGFSRKHRGIERELVLAVDQSGSMAESVVYAALFGAVLASIRSLRTSLVAFDTAVADLTADLHDPIDVLFGTQLGGGTDINAAVAYCETLITEPRNAIFVLISDLYEGGLADSFLARMRGLVESGVRVVTLLALSDSGAPSYDHRLAASLAELAVPAFACTPDAFPDLLAAAIARDDLTGWVHRWQAESARRRH